MTLWSNVSLSMPPRGRSLMGAAGLLTPYPKPDKFSELFARLAKLEDSAERDVLLDYIRRDLHTMRKVAHNRLPQLLAVARQYEAQLTDEWLAALLAALESYFHFERNRIADDRAAAPTLLPLACEALEWIDMKMQRQVARQQDTLSEMASRAIYYFRAVSALAALDEEAGRGWVLRARATLSWLVLWARIDPYALNMAQQAELQRGMQRLIERMPAAYIPGGVEVEPADGFWLEWEEQALRAKPRLTKPLRRKVEENRLVMPISPLLEQIDPALLQPGEGTMRMLTHALSEQTSRHLRRAIGNGKRRFDRVPCREMLRWSIEWNDVAMLPEIPSSPTMLRNIDAGGFLASVERSDTALPMVDALIGVRLADGSKRRARVVWRRLQPQGGEFGAQWLDGDLNAARIDLLGNNEIGAKKRSWQALVHAHKVVYDDDGIASGRVTCWFGEPSLQPGFSLLLPLSGKNYAAQLLRVDYRGGNFCRGEVAIGKPWKSSALALAIEEAS